MRAEYGGGWVLEISWRGATRGFFRGGCWSSGEEMGDAWGRKLSEGLRMEERRLIGAVSWVGGEEKSLLRIELFLQSHLAEG